MVITHYQGFESQDCFAIGWFYAMDEETVKLKVTSTAFETYENILIPIKAIKKMEDYQRN